MVGLIHPSRWTLASLALATLLPSLAASIANIALPTLAASYSTTFASVQWVVLAYLIATTGALVLVGWLGDRLGHRRLLVVGLGVIATTSLAAGLAPALWVLVTARALQGVGAAFSTVLALAFVSEAVPAESTGRAMGLLGAMSALGTALGPSLGGVLIESLGWRGIFLATVPPALLATVLARRHLPVGRTPSTVIAGELRGHLASLLAPFGRRHLRAHLTANLIVSTMLMGTLVVGPFYLADVLALDPAAIGGIVAVGPVVAALFGLPAGHLVDRLGARRSVLVGLAGIAVGAVSLAALPDTLGVPGYVAPIAAMTASYALFQAANNTAVMSGANSDERGVVSGALGLTRNVGLIGGTALMGAVFAEAGMRVTFALGGALILVALLLMRALSAPVRPDPHDAYRTPAR